MFLYLSLTRMKFPSIVALVAVTDVVHAVATRLPPYLEDLKWEAPRSLSNWSNLTVQTRTGTIIGILNDTYPNVRQFLRVPFAQVSVSPRKEVSLPGNSLTFSTCVSRLLGTSVGCLHRSFHLHTGHTMLRHTVLVC